MSVVQAQLPEPGTMLGPYELLDRLGKGGFSVVYRARHAKMKREVALKALAPVQALEDKTIAQRFLLEIDIIQQLEHPNIIRLYDHGESEGLLWMAMELVRGDELAKVLARDGAMEPQRVKAIALQVLSGLAEAHARSIVHRDLKPGNIMLSKTVTGAELVKLLDFGIGKILGEAEEAVMQNLTMESTGSVGTPRYMAPELLKNADIGPHSDIYALGLILFEMLTGKAAVTGRSTYEVLTRQIAETLELPEWLKGTPLGALLLKATRKKYRKRFPDALAMLEALQSIADDELVMKVGEATTGFSQVMRKLEVGEVPELKDAFQEALADIFDENTSDSVSLEPNTADSVRLAEATPPPSVPPTSDEAPDTAAVDATEPSPVSTPLAVGAENTRPPWLIPAAIGGGVLLLVIILAIAFSGGEDAETPAETAEAGASEETTPQPDVVEGGATTEPPEPAFVELPPPSSNRLEIRRLEQDERAKTQAEIIKEEAKSSSSGGDPNDPFNIKIH